MKKNGNPQALMLTSKSFPLRTGMVAWMDQQACALTEAGYEVRHLAAFELPSGGWDGPYSLTTLHKKQSREASGSSFGRFLDTIEIILNFEKQGFCPDVVLTDSTPSLMFLGCRLRSRLGCQFIAVVGGNYFNEFSSKVKQAVVKRLYRCADGIVVDGGDLVQLMLSLGIPNDRVHFVPHGIDTEKFCPGASSHPFQQFLQSKGFKLDKAKSIVFSHGTLKDSTGCDLIPELAKGVPDAEFVLAGSGPMESELKRQGASNLAMVGFMTGDLLPSAFGMSEVCVYPFRQMAGVSLAVVEAMSCGRVVVVTDCGDLKTIVKDGVNGFMVAKNDTEALKARVKQLLDDPELRNKMGDAAREEVLANWSLEKRQKDFVQLIDSL